MNVWNYLELHNERDNVLNALSRLPFDSTKKEDAINRLKRYRFVINHRAKSRCGCVKHSEAMMEMSSEYYTHGYNIKSEGIEDHRDTLLHETAHILVRALSPGSFKPHGPVWKTVMRQLGATPRASGSSPILKEARNKNHKHEYTCQNCGYMYKTMRQLKRIDKRWHGPCGKIKGRLTHRQVR